MAYRRPFDDEQKPFDPNEDDEQGGYLSALNEQLGVEPASDPQGSRAFAPHDQPTETAPQSESQSSESPRDQALNEVSQTYSAASQSVVSPETASDPGGSVSGPRWSYHLARPNDWISALTPEQQEQVRAIYNDPNSDPNAHIADLLANFRQQSAGQGLHADEGDLGAISQMFGNAPTLPNPGGNPGPPPAAAAPPAAPSTPAPAAPSTPAPAGLSQILLQQLTNLLNPVSVDDAALAPQLAANRLQSQRDADRARMVAAERRAAQGLGDSGAMETDIRGIEEDRAEDTQKFQADLLADEHQSRRDAISSLLGLGLVDENTDAGRAQQADQFRQSLSQQQQQFLDNMGFNWANLESSQNLQALMALLGAAA